MISSFPCETVALVLRNELLMWAGECLSAIIYVAGEGEPEGGPPAGANGNAPGVNAS